MSWVKHFSCPRYISRWSTECLTNYFDWLENISRTMYYSSASRGVTVGKEWTTVLEELFQNDMVQNDVFPSATLWKVAWSGVGYLGCSIAIWDSTFLSITRTCWIPKTQKKTVRDTQPMVLRQQLFALNSERFLLSKSLCTTGSLENIRVLFSPSVPLHTYW